MHKIINKQVVHSNIRKLHAAKVRTSNVKAVDDTTHHAHLLCTKKVSHPDVAQFEVRQNEPFVFGIVVLRQGRKGHQKPTDVHAQIVIAVRLAKSGKQSLTKSRLFVDRFTPGNAIEYTKIVDTQRHSVQSHGGAVFREIVEDVVREEVRPDRLVGEQAFVAVVRVFFEEGRVPAR